MTLALIKCKTPHPTSYRRAQFIVDKPTCLCPEARDPATRMEKYDRAEIVEGDMPIPFPEDIIGKDFATIEVRLRRAHVMQNSHNL